MMKKYNAKRITFLISDEIGDTSALYIRPPKPKFLLVLAHGAGAGMEHPFMENLQGTRDVMAKVDLMKKVTKRLKKAKLEFLEGGNHSLKMLKSTGVPHEEVIAKAAKLAADFIQ